MRAYIRLTILSLLLIIITSTSLSAQIAESETFSSNSKENLPEVTSTSKEAVSKKIPSYFRHHKQLSAYFTGYAIELTTADFPLQRDYFLFEKFGNVYVDKLPKGGFSYLITQFNSKEAAEKHLKNIVIHHATEAKVITYIQGKRKG